MHRSTKACSITKKVKDRVYERDNGVCIICGSTYGRPEAHYISRKRLGLGIEQNIVTLCPKCHYTYDFGIYMESEPIKEKIRNYLSSKYEGWNEAGLVYSKYAF